MLHALLKQELIAFGVTSSDALLKNFGSFTPPSFNRLKEKLRSEDDSLQ